MPAKLVHLYVSCPDICDLAKPVVARIQTWPVPAGTQSKREVDLEQDCSVIDPLTVPTIGSKFFKFD